jgi:serine/threonine protein kinase
MNKKNISYKKKYRKYLKKENLLNNGGFLNCGDIGLDMKNNSNYEYEGTLMEGFYNEKNRINIFVEKTQKGNPIKIGSGSQGSIYKGYLIGDDKTKKEIVIKSIFINNENDNEIKNICREISVLTKLNNENIVKYYGYTHEIIDNEEISQSSQLSQSQLSLSTSMSPKANENISMPPPLLGWSLSSSSLKFYEKTENIYLFMEYINGVNLEMFVEKMKKSNNIDYDKILVIGKKLIDGLQYLHSQNIVHRDIKPLNIMIIDNNNPFDIVVKYIDFGISCLKDKNCDNNISGTYIYMSLELYFNDKNVDLFKNDMWSLGMTLYYLFSFEKFVNEIEKNVDFMHIPDYFTKIIKNENIINDKIEETKFNINELNIPKIIEIIKNLLKLNPDERRIIM